jgi:hypothetical protein
LAGGYRYQGVTGCFLMALPFGNRWRFFIAKQGSFWFPEDERIVSLLYSMIFL